MIQTVIFIVVTALLGCAILAGVYRLFRGPTVFDRMLGFDLIAIISVVLVLVFSASISSTEFVEFALVLSALGFLTTVSYFYYLTQAEPVAPQNSASSAQPWPEAAEPARHEEEA